MAVKHALHYNVEPKFGFGPTTVNDNSVTSTAIIDCQGVADVEFVFVTGTLADADATFAVTIEHGDQANLSDAVTVEALDLLGTTEGASFNYADDNKVKRIGYRPAKRYVRAKVTPSNNSAAASYACVVLVNPLRVPVP
ncbi:MAG: hypothetical protein NZM12_10540 [Steroidobacteraceae bacterium]|nr:hypothetical protein [Steroidobacteraceae bacterium]MDW8259793.1 hypothetical protein [Gammaproteobacteria bacterium]